MESNEVNGFALQQAGLAGKQQVPQNPPQSELRDVCYYAG
jgi:hypothetical protein